jgi:acyl-coenzyme A thioesterase PaaI-like protein
MVNALGYPHGGVIFTLADFTFGAACNSHGKDSVAWRAGFYAITVTTAGGGRALRRAPRGVVRNDQSPVRRLASR